jgi:dihydrofolate synthase/folylpolyglutamate synthase
MLMGREFDSFEECGRLRLQLAERLLDLPPPALFGAHQFENAALAAAAMLAFDPRFDEGAIGLGITRARWPARFQRLVAGPLAEKARARGADLWLDGGHNPHAGRALAAACAALAARDQRPLALIAGMLTRKDAAGFLAPFGELHARLFTTAFDSPSAMSAQTLTDAARSVGLTAQPAAGVKAALEAALDLPGAAPHVLICGSLHFAGDVLAMSPQTWPS